MGFAKRLARITVLEVEAWPEPFVFERQYASQATNGDQVIDFCSSNNSLQRFGFRNCR
jgi:hypothetical protein